MIDENKKKRERRKIDRRTKRNGLREAVRFRERKRIRNFLKKPRKGVVLIGGGKETEKLEK